MTQAVSIKATTHEQLGDIGQGKALAAQVIVLIDQTKIG